MFTTLLVFGLLAAFVNAAPADQANQSSHSDHSHAWLGKWESTPEGEENLQQLIDHIKDAIPHYTTKKITHEYIEQGDEFVHKVQVEGGQDYEVKFKLNQDHSWHLGNEPEIKYKYTEEGPNKLKVHMNIPSKNKELKECYTVEGDKITKEYESGTIKAKRIYKKVQK